MVLNLKPKCANPSCAVSFDWLGGGKLFRFPRSSSQAAPAGGIEANVPHPIGHFWLCERCSTIYTLQFDPGRGVVILPLWPELPAAPDPMHLPSV